MKPLLKCPYPVDGWGREMRITLSILIAKRIHQLRKSRNLSVNELATMSGLSYSTLNSILRCKSKSPTLGTLIWIATALNMTILEFLDVPEIVNFSYDDMDDSNQDDDESRGWSHNLKELICNERFYTNLL